MSDRIRVTVTDDRTGEVLGVQFAVDDYVLSICHDFGCTHNPCRCVPQLRSERTATRRNRTLGGLRVTERSFCGRWYGNKVRRRWWSFVNWSKGYRWSAIRRHRCCDHTTPSHYTWCSEYAPKAHAPMMHGVSRSGLTVDRWGHPWEPDCDERGCVYYQEGRS